MPSDLSEFKTTKDLIEKVILPMMKSYSSEYASGTVDGSNRTFSASRDYIPETLVVFLNGLRQLQDEDYVIKNSTQIEFTLAPESNDLVTLEYIPADV